MASGVVMAKPSTCKSETEAVPEAESLVNHVIRKNAQSQKNCAAKVATAKYKPLTRKLGTPKNIPTKVENTPPKRIASTTGMPSTRIKKL